MYRLPPICTRTDTLLPYMTPFRSTPPVTAREPARCSRRFSVGFDEMVVAAEQQLVDRVAAPVRERGVGPAVEARGGGDGARVAHGQGMGFAARIQPRALAGSPPGHARPGVAMQHVPLPPVPFYLDTRAA